jgi:predicted ATPase
MKDKTESLRKKFSPHHRYANFGPVIRSITVQGFRGITHPRIEFTFPITAFSGLNGAGKSTIGQLMVCGYKAPSADVKYRPYYVKDFFPSSVADPQPFEPGARVIYRYETDKPSAVREVTVSRKVAEWSGYKRQPERFCYYVGSTLYLPKVERRDLSIYRAAHIDLREKRIIPDELRATVSLILSQPYDEVAFQVIGHKDRELELGMARRYGKQYSENNMGFGEGRALYMIDLLENVPEQSLFVLEEPETSLHEDAQYQLAKYLLEVADRRHHQIIISTHSSVVLEALPAEARKFIYRDNSGILIYDHISATRAKAILSRGYRRGLIVCVEDDFAQLLLTEMIRAKDPALLKAVEIQPIGSRDAVRTGVELLGNLGIKAIGIRDGDVGAHRAERLYSLPGSRPPEVEVYGHANVKCRLKGEYGVDVDQLLAANPELDHHQLTQFLAGEAEALPDALATLAVKEYVGSLEIGQIDLLVKIVQENA